MALIPKKMGAMGFKPSDLEYDRRGLQAHCQATGRKIEKSHTLISGQIADDIYQRQINHGCTADRK